MARSLQSDARLSRGLRPGGVLTGFLVAGILAAGLAAQPPAVKPPQPRQEAFERFHKMSPEERLNHVARTVGIEKAFTAVVREDLELAVVERGSVESADASDIVSRVKGQATVKWVLEDGSAVKKGDRLIELDDTALREQLAAQKIALDQAQAVKLTAAADLKLTQKETELAVPGCELSVQLARQELKKDDGKDPERKEILELKLAQAQRALEVAKLRGLAAELKAEAELQAKAVALEREAKRKNDLEAQLAECVMRAPQAGMAVYYIPEASRFGKPAAILAVGEPVREGQKLLQIVGLERFNVITRIHEADVSRIRVGQQATVRVDAFARQEFRGRVKEVSPVASQADWFARDVKVYPTTVELSTAPPGLKPGMSAEVHIEVTKLSKVLQVPLGAVVRIERETFCYVPVGKEIQARKVTLGARNARNVEVKEGLQDGGEVLRSPGQ